MLALAFILTLIAEGAILRTRNRAVPFRKILLIAVLVNVITYVLLYLLLNTL